MNLCFLTTAYPRTNGDDAGIFVQRLADALGAKAEKILVIAPRDRNEPNREIGSKTEVIRFEYKRSNSKGIAFGAGIIPNLTRHPSLALQLPALGVAMLYNSFANRKSYDLILANWIFSGFIALLNKIITGKPYIYVVRGAEIKILPTILGRFLFKIVIANSRHTVCVSEEFSSKLKNEFPRLRERISYIANGISIDLSAQSDQHIFFERKHLDPVRKRLLFVGTIIPRKNVAWLIKIMTQSELDDFDLILCGRLDDQTYVSQLKSLIVEGGFSSRVRLEGEIDPKDVPDYLKSASAYVTASVHEGTPNSLLEALAVGKVVFASDIPAHRRIISDGHNGFIFNLQEPYSLAKRITAVLGDLSLVRKIELNAQNSVKDWSWHACAERYWEIIKSR